MNVYLALLVASAFAAVIAFYLTRERRKAVPEAHTRESLLIPEVAPGSLWCERELEGCPFIFQAAEVLSVKDGCGHCAPATGSGFAVVARHHSLGYTPVTNPTLARGYRFEEVWIFGMPSRADELDLWRAVAPIVTIMEPSTVHRIPND